MSDQRQAPLRETEQDLEPIARQSDKLSEEQRDRVDIADVSTFVDVAKMAQAALEDNVAPLPVMDHLRQEHRDAVRALYLARHGDVDRGEGYVSALERMQLLNRGLAALQPVLSLGLSEELGGVCEHYAGLQTSVCETRAAIKQKIAVESKPHRGRAAFVDVKDGADEGESEDDSTGANNDRVVIAVKRAVGTRKRRNRKGPHKADGPREDGEDSDNPTDDPSVKGTRE